MTGIVLSSGGTSSRPDSRVTAPKRSHRGRRCARNDRKTSTSAPGRGPRTVPAAKHAAQRTRATLGEPRLGARGALCHSVLVAMQWQRQDGYKQDVEWRSEEGGQKGEGQGS